MTFWDWVRSGIIFVAAVFILNNFFISLTVWEAIVLTIFAAICVFHTVDVREDIMKKMAEKRAATEAKYTGPERRRNGGLE